MKSLTPIAVLAAAAALFGSSASAVSAAPETAAQAFAKFDAAWAKLTSYSCTLTSHEVEGTRVQDRVYQLYFRKPYDTRMNVTAGDDKGAEAVYTGGDTVKGHHGGWLSFVHLNLNIHNSQATSVRGTTIAEANFEALVEHIKGLSGATIDTTPDGDRMKIDVSVADPSTDQNVTREMMVLGADGLPVEFDQWEGQDLVKHQTFADLKVNVDIPDSTFSL